MSGSTSAFTSTSVLAGRMSPKTSPCARPTSLPLRDVGHVDARAHHVAQRGAGARERRDDVGERLPRLRVGVAAPTRRPPGVRGRRARHPDVRAAAHGARVADDRLPRRAAREVAGGARRSLRTAAPTLNFVAHSPISSLERTTAFQSPPTAASRLRGDEVAHARARLRARRSPARADLDALARRQADRHLARARGGHDLVAAHAACSPSTRLTTTAPTSGRARPRSSRGDHRPGLVVRAGARRRRRGRRGGGRRGVVFMVGSVSAASG